MITLPKFINAECPYCGLVNKFQSEILTTGNGSVVITCDHDEGGCDKPFVVSVTIVVEVNVYKMISARKDNPL